MKVYLIYMQYAFEGPEYVVGVYSTLEKAQTAQETVSKRHRSWIEEEEVK